MSASWQSQTAGFNSVQFLVKRSRCFDNVLQPSEFALFVSFLHQYIMNLAAFTAFTKHKSKNQNKMSAFVV